MSSPTVGADFAKTAVPGMWATHMNKMEILLGEMPSMPATEVDARAWLKKYEALSVSRHH